MSEALSCMLFSGREAYNMLTAGVYNATHCSENHTVLYTQLVVYVKMLQCHPRNSYTLNHTADELGNLTTILCFYHDARDALTAIIIQRLDEIILHAKRHKQIIILTYISETRDIVVGYGNETLILFRYFHPDVISLIYRSRQMVVQIKQNYSVTDHL